MWASFHISCLRIQLFRTIWAMLIPWVVFHVGFVRLFRFWFLHEKMFPRMYVFENLVDGLHLTLKYMKMASKAFKCKFAMRPCYNAYGLETDKFANVKKCRIRQKWLYTLQLFIYNLTLLAVCNPHTLYQMRKVLKKLLPSFRHNSISTKQQRWKFPFILVKSCMLKGFVTELDEFFEDGIYSLFQWQLHYNILKYDAP